MGEQIFLFFFSKIITTSLQTPDRSKNILQRCNCVSVRLTCHMTKKMRAAHSTKVSM